MKALIRISLIATALAAASAPSEAGSDACTAKSVHGIWDCR
jgi:hypothetical protein